MVRSTYTFICDRCGREEKGGESSTSNWGEKPCTQGYMPIEWWRTHGYDLCPSCTQGLSVRSKIIKKFNDALWKMKSTAGPTQEEAWQWLWEACRIRCYAPMHEYVNELREKKEKKGK